MKMWVEMGQQFGHWDEHTHYRVEVTKLNGSVKITLTTLNGSSSSHKGGSLILPDQAAAVLEKALSVTTSPFPVQPVTFEVDEKNATVRVGAAAA